MGMQNKGYTIAELAVSIAVLAGIIGGGLSFFAKNENIDAYQNTQARIEYIKSAINTYTATNGFVPCPGPGNSLDTDVGFGSSAGIYDSTTDKCEIGLTNGVGMVPVRTLGIPDEYAYDGWGRKFSYKVADGLGGATDYSLSTNYGNIRIINSRGDELTNTDDPYNPKGAAYVIISHGPGGRGAWHKNDSTNPIAITGIESINARHLTAESNIFIQDKPFFGYDDIVGYDTKLPIGLTAANIYSPIRVPSYTCTNAKKIVDAGVPTGVLPVALRDQIFTSAQSILTLCNHQMPLCYQSPPIIRSSNLYLWLDGSDPIANGNPPADGSVLATWRDKSDNGFSLTRVDNGSNGRTATYDESTRFANSRPAVQLSGDHYLLNPAPGISGSAFTAFFAITRGTPSIYTFERIFQIIDVGAGESKYFGFNYNNNFAFIGSDSGISNNNTIAVIPTHSFSKPMIATLFFGDTNGIGIRLVDVDQVLAEEFNPNNVSTLNNYTRLSIGQVTSNSFNGHIGEVIIYSAYLTNAERMAIESYLIKKWLTGEC